jgi:hypothetical protein
MNNGVTAGADVTVDLGGVCPGSPQSFVGIPVQATVTPTGGGPVVLGCSPLTVTQLVVAESDVAQVTATCGQVPSALVPVAQAVAATAITPLLQSAIAGALAGQSCLR